ncbi:MAG: M48 family metallopeptidase [Gammaproteobacteria bacterium]|nr:M48 family metallopeptidase [Gammaproteobacteria bacterium]
MDFFSAQEAARKQTTLMIALFALAVLLLVVLTNLFLMAAMAIAGAESDPGHLPGAETFMRQFSWLRFFAVGAAVAVVILLGSLFRSWTMGRGGKAVAEMMGGALVSQNSADPDHRRLLNIVEEIAIASGTQVPLVYVMQNEPAINAFAAGITSGDAAIVVTHGCLRQLNRNELQGIIAHEFSHILNGDMRLNMRLIGILFGILMLGLIGRFLIRASGSSRSSSKQGNGLPLIALGAGLFILGYAGTFIGNLIKASVSRQREYLADASAVQFTRDPDGIGGALIRIGANKNGSLLRNADAAEFSHTFFSEGVRNKFLSLLATHPPLKQRILRILPRWDGDFIVRETMLPEHSQQSSRQQSSKQQSASDVDRVRMATATTMLLELFQRIEKNSPPDAKTITYAADVVKSIPEAIIQHSRDPYGARAILFALLLDADDDAAAQQISALRKQAGNGVARLTQQLLPVIQRLLPQQRLAVIEMAVPALRELSARHFQLFTDTIDFLIRFDANITLFEWTLQKIVVCSLATDHKRGALQSDKSHLIEELLPECAILLSIIARSPRQDDVETGKAFHAAAKELKAEQLLLPASHEATVEALDGALVKLAQLRPLHKQRLLKACAVCVSADGRAAAVEVELLRAISLLLNCPMSPTDPTSSR